MDENVKCENCEWNGKRNALLKHLKMKSQCRSLYDMERLQLEHKELRKLKRQMYDKNHYSNNKEEKKQYYQENRKKRKKYQKQYYKENLDQRQYYQENKEKLKQYQRQYDEIHKEKKKEYYKLKAHYKKYDGRIDGLFQNNNIGHFVSHIEGWCTNVHWKDDFFHKHCWEEVQKECEQCQIKLYKCKSKSGSKPFEINALHCISCFKITCNLCRKNNLDYNYFKHFYIRGLNSHLKEKAELCPYRTYLDIEVCKNFPCQICTRKETIEKRTNFVERVGVHYFHWYEKESDQVKSVKTTLGHEILNCPYNENDVKSTICLNDATAKLTKRVVGCDFKAWPNMPNPNYIKTLQHKPDLEHMCQLEKHMNLHEKKRLESNLIELTLKSPYGKSPDDLKIIDTLLKHSIENLTQIYRIKKIVPADRCLGLNTIFLPYNGTQEAWLAYSRKPNTKLPFKMFHPLSQGSEITNQMEKDMDEMKKNKQILYMVVTTYENSIEDPIAYFEKLPLFPDWVEEKKLLFTWSAKKIMEEEDSDRQEAIIREHFIESKNHPGYFMKLDTASICDCNSCDYFCEDAVSNANTVPVSGCPLPLIKSPLQRANVRRGYASSWEEMFKYAWNTLHNSNESDSSLSSETESSEATPEESEYETDESAKWYN